MFLAVYSVLPIRMLCGSPQKQRTLKRSTEQQEHTPSAINTTASYPPPPHTHTHTLSTTHQQNKAVELSRPVLHDIHICIHFSSRTPTCSTCVLYRCIPFSAVHRLVLHIIHMHTFFSRMSTCSTCYTYACLSSRTLTCSTRHTCAYLFQPVAEVKEGVAGVCERCVRCSYPQVFTVQQHVQMSMCVHPLPDNTARSDIT